MRLRGGGLVVFGSPDAGRFTQWGFGLLLFMCWVGLIFFNMLKPCIKKEPHPIPTRAIIWTSKIAVWNRKLGTREERNHTWKEREHCGERKCLLRILGSFFFSPQVLLVMVSYHSSRNPKSGITHTNLETWTASCEVRLTRWLLGDGRAPHVEVQE